MGMSHFTNKYELDEELMDRLVRYMKARYKERPDPTKKNKEIMHGTSIDNVDLIDVYEAFNLALRNYCFLHGHYLLKEQRLEEERRINKAQKEIIMELLREHNLI